MADANAEIKVNIDTSDALSSLKLLQAQISAFQQQMARSGAAAAQAATNMQQNLLNNINATGQFSATLKNIQTDTEAFTTSLEKNKLSLGQYFKYAGGASKSFGKMFRTEFDTIQKVAVERVKDLQTQYIQLGRDANGAMKSIAVRPLALDMESLGTKTQIAAQKQQLLNQLLKQGSTNLLNFGKNTQWAGRQLMVGFTIPLSMLGATAAKTFMEMEEQVIKFKRVYGDLGTTVEETNKMSKEIQNLANQFTQYGVAVKDTMALAAQAAASGKTGADLTAQVTEATRLAVLGQVDQQQALETTISLTNAFGVSADKLKGKINFLNAVENQTVTSIEDLTVAIPKAGPVIEQLGGNVEDLTFFLTAMKEGGINASEGANALKSGLAAIINPTDTASKMLQGFGINIKGLVDSNKGDVKGLIMGLATALNKLDPTNRARAIEQMFGKFQFARISTLFKNVVAEGSQANRVLELTQSSSMQLASLASQELDKVSKSPMYRFKKAVEDIKTSLMPVGEEFLKLATPLIEFGTKILDSFNKLDSGTKQFITGFTAVVAGIGPVLLMTFGLVANGVANIIKGFTFVKNVFNRAGSASTILGEQVSYMTQEQLNAAAVAASLEQSHNNLTQAFNVEAGAVANLRVQYERTTAAQMAFSGMNNIPRPGSRKFATGGMVTGPGTGTSDSIPAMVSNGEFIVSAKRTRQYLPLLQNIAQGKVPGFASKDIGGSLVGKRAKPEASHFTSLTPESLSGTIEEMLSFAPEFKNLKITLIEVAKGLDGVTEASKREVSMGDLSGKKTLFAGGLAHGGTTIAESGTRNQLYNILGISGAADTIDSLIEQGRIAEQALADHAAGIKKINADYLPEAQKLANQGKEASKALAMSNNQEQVRVDYMRNIAKERIAQGLVAKKSIPVEQARLEAEKLLLIQDKLIAKSNDKLIAARARYTMASIAYGGTGEFAATQSEDPNIISATRDVSRGNATIYSQASSVNPNARRQARRVRPLFNRIGRVFGYKGAYTSEVAQKFSQAGMPLPSSAASAGLPNLFNDTLQTEAQTASPSKRTKKIAKDIVDGIEVGLKEGMDDARVAGENLADSLVTGARKQGARRVISDPSNTMSQAGAVIVPRGRGGNGRARSRQGTVQPDGTVIPTMILQPGYEAADPMSNGFIGPQLPTRKEKLQQKITNLKTGYNNLKTGQTKLSGFKVSAGLGTASMAAGMAGMAGVPGMGELSAVLGVVSMFGGAISKVVPMLLRFAGPIGIAITAIGGLVTVVNLINDAKKRELEYTNGLADTIKVTSGKFKSLGDIFGISPTELSYGAAGSGLNAKQKSDVQLLKGSEGYKDPEGILQKYIKQVTTATPEMTKATLENLSMQLSASGFDKQAVQTIVTAVQQDAKKTSLVLDFENLEIGSANGRQTMVNNLMTSIQNMSSNWDKRSKQFVGKREGGIIKTLIGADLKKTSQEAKAILTSTLASLQTAFNSGIIDAENYQASVSSVLTTITNLEKSDPAQAIYLLNAAIAGSGLEGNLKKIADGIDTVAGKIELLKVQMYAASKLDNYLFKTKIVSNPEDYDKEKVKEAQAWLDKFDASSLAPKDLPKTTKDTNTYTGAVDALSASQKTAVSAIDKKIKALEKERDALKEVNNELDRKQEFELSAAQRAIDAKEAMLSGNYLKAALLKEENAQAQLKFDRETKMLELEKKIADLEARKEKISSGSSKSSNGANNGNNSKSNLPVKSKEPVKPKTALKEGFVWELNSDKTKYVKKQVTKPNPVAGQTLTWNKETGIWDPKIIPPGKKLTLDQATLIKNATNRNYQHLSILDLKNGNELNYNNKKWEIVGITPDGGNLKYTLQDITAIKKASEIPVSPTFANGGLVKGPGTGTSDSIFAGLKFAQGGGIRVSNGEFVTRAASVDKYGVSFMNSINNGSYNPETSSGGSVYNINMTVNGGNASASEIADMVMKKFNTIQAKNNTSNKVMF